MKRPEPGEIVVCKITKINPHSAFAKIEGYDTDGLIHISEIASGWVKDIKEHIKEGQTVIAKVLSSEDKGVMLSIKRVDKNQRDSKIREYEKEKKAEKMLRVVAKNVKQPGKLEEVSSAIKERFGAIYSAFEMTPKSEEILREILNDKWFAALKEIAEKNARTKEFEFRAKIFLVSYEPDGIKKISGALQEIEKTGLEVIYISAPEYLLKFRSAEPKKGENEFNKKLEDAESISKKFGCFKEIKILK